MKALIIPVLILLSLSSLFGEAFSGSSGVGNGGDEVRDNFFVMGHNILINYRSGFDQVKTQLQTVGINDPQSLSKFLSIEHVRTQTQALIDNSGSAVSAIGEPGLITLYVGTQYPNLSWSWIFKDSYRAERMIVHELLRAAGVNDDNFALTNIVLKNQGVVENSNFHFVWSKKNHELINLAMSFSFNSKSTTDELQFFQKSAQQLVTQNNLKYAELVAEYVRFHLQFIDSMNQEASATKIQLIAYRNLFRSLLKLNQIVDEFGYWNSSQSPTASGLLRQFYALSLRQTQEIWTLYPRIQRNILIQFYQKLQGLAYVSLYPADFVKNSEPAFHEIQTLVENGADQTQIREKVMRLADLLSRP